MQEYIINKMNHQSRFDTDIVLVMAKIGMTRRMVRRGGVGKRVQD